MAKKDKKVKEIKPNLLNIIFENAWYVLLIYFIIILLMLWESLFSGRMTAGSDFLASGYMNRVFLANHGFRLWQPYTFCGVPTVDAVFGDILYPVTIILRQIFAPHILPVLLYLIHLPLAGIFTYLFMKDQKISAPIAFLSGLFYMLAGCIVSLINAGHDGRLIVNCLLPGVIFFINRGYDRNRIIYFILTGLFFGLAVLSPHAQMAYYLVLASFIFVIFKTIKKWQEAGFGSVVKPGLSYVLSGAIGVGLAACFIISIFYYIQFSPRGGPGRGYLWATSWAMPPEEIFNLVTPHFSGLLENYWGRNFFKLHTEYLGILPLLFALFAIIKEWKRPLTKFLVVLALFSFVMAIGGHTPIYRLFYVILPGVSRFRAPSQIFYLIAFAIAVLAGIGGERLLNSEQNKKTRIVWYVCGGVFIFWLLSNLFAQGFISLFASFAEGKGRIITNNYPNFQSGLFVTFILLTIYAVMIFAVSRKKLSLVNFCLIAGIIFFIDMWRVEKNFIRTVDPPSKYFAPDEVVRVLNEDPSLYRMYPFSFWRLPNPIGYRQDNYPWLFDLQNIGGEHGNHLMRYQEFIGAEHSVMFYPTNLFYRNFLNLLNVKYVIVPNIDYSQVPEYHPDPYFDATIKTIRYVTDPTYFKLFYQGRMYQIYQNLYLLPRAFLVSQYRTITDKQEILETIKSNAFNPAKIVILEEDPGVISPADSVLPGQVKIISYESDQILLQTRLSRSGFLVLTDNYYPSWQARVNGEPVKIFRADYTFRAIYLPPGEHEITFNFISSHFKLGSIISLLTFFCSILAVIILTRQKRY